MKAPVWTERAEVTTAADYFLRALETRSPELIEAMHHMAMVFGHLTLEGKREFTQELAGALAKEAKTWDAVEGVVEAWHRSWLFRRNPDHGAVVEEAWARYRGEIPPAERGQTVEELRKELEG
ncbi:MAG: hypothetical protein ACRENM_04960 [Candidatus Dormibacteraceae bacterium]